MLPKANDVGWMGGEDDDAVSWTRNNNGDTKDDDMNASLSTFKSMLESDWYINNALNPSHQDIHTILNHHEFKDMNMTFCSNPTDHNLLLQPMDSSSSCSPSQAAFSLDPSQIQSFLPPKSCCSSLFNVVCNNPFDNGFDLGCDATFLANQSSNSPVLMGFNSLSSRTHMATPELNSNYELNVKEYQYSECIERFMRWQACRQQNWVSICF
ncbi:transcription factor ICE1-like [Cornus florida]|uniref:transcription factor ICE1-like n=1 Tax=Cornus florida TaxID=4283 RepID=UPI002898D26B|nr:transcription factor ICE1-like [Cornus florida]